MILTRATAFGAIILYLLATTPIRSPQDSRKVYVRVNQLGYKLSGPKVGIALSENRLPERFTVTDGVSHQVAFTGSTKPVAGRWGQFTYHAELDFTSLNKSGCYFITLGEITSPQFEVAENIFNPLPDQLLEFMRQQRCGYNPWLDAVCHPFDGRTAYGPLPAGTYLDARGGWHDAGDLLKYLLTASNATAQLLLAYQLGPKESFRDDFNDLGQTKANGIPDVLDEARWGLDWMLRLHPSRDQLYHQVADDRDHRGWRLPQNETVDYGWGAGSFRVVYFADGQPQGLKEFKSQSNGIANIAGRYAAAMALGYQIWKHDSRLANYAQRLLTAGREVYAMGKLKEGVQQGNSYGAPYRYEETTWEDDMEWGASELFRATGEKQFISDAVRYARLAGRESWMGKTQTGHYQFYPFMNVAHYRLYDLVPKATKKLLAQYYRDGLESCVETAKGNPYEVGVPFIWCSNNLVVALATQEMLYEIMTGDARYQRFGNKQIDWLLGRNPWGMSMFTEIPAAGTYPHDVHLMTIAILKRPVRGGLVDGPVYRRIFQSLKGVSITEPDPFAAFQDELAVYHDDVKDYSTNEPTMDGTASAILLWALKARQPRIR